VAAAVGEIRLTTSVNRRSGVQEIVVAPDLVTSCENKDPGRIQKGLS
jgi:hypothetical protein